MNVNETNGQTRNVLKKLLRLNLFNTFVRVAQKKDNMKKDLDTLLEDWQVMDPLMWENNDGPKGWYAVCNTDGIVAYFGKEEDALRFRLSEINRALNG